MKTIPEIGDQIWHQPTKQSFTVKRRTKMPDGSIKLNGEYFLDDCISASTTPLTPGDAVMDVKSGHHAVVVKIEGNLAQIDGHSICGWVTVTDLIAVDAVEVQNDDTGALLDQHALTSLLGAVESMIRSGCYELDLLEALTQGQKRQLWDCLTVDRRDALKAARSVEVAA